MAEGTIKTVTERGFGFISPDDGSTELFFHRSALVGVPYEHLRRGDRVVYSVEADPRRKGPRAARVHRAQ
jgi:CspA family cold shock protein